CCNDEHLGKDGKYCQSGPLIGPEGLHRVGVSELAARPAARPAGDVGDTPGHFYAHTQTNKQLSDGQMVTGPVLAVAFPLSRSTSSACKRFRRTGPCCRPCTCGRRCCRRLSFATRSCTSSACRRAPVPRLAS